MAHGYHSTWLGWRSGALVFAVVFASTFVTGCGLRPDVRKAETDNVPGATPDTADAAARKFFAAVARKDVEAAVNLVLPADRPRARKEFDRPPTLPKELFLETKVRGNRAQAHCTNPGFERLGLDMIFVDNQWWVVLQ